jgi:transcriptional regulator with XRE-family HTH domain
VQKRCYVDMLVGNHVRALRLERGLSQQALGAAIGVGAEDIKQFEAGLKRVGAARLLAIARVFEVEIEFFFTSSESQAAKAGTADGRPPPKASRSLH